MKVEHSKSPLPKKWKTMPFGELIDETYDIYATGGSRICLKLLLFNKRREMRKFWNSSDFGGKICKHTMGAVNALSYTNISWDDNGKEYQKLVVDPRYFAVMALNREDMSVGIIAHEAVHAAFAYADRMGKRNPFREQLGSEDEEIYCYPAGYITEEIYRIVYGKNI